jgi:hypothetical protein
MPAGSMISTFVAEDIERYVKRTVHSLLCLENDNRRMFYLPRYSPCPSSPCNARHHSPYPNLPKQNPNSSYAISL